MRTKRKMTVTIICILFAVLFAWYGFWMSGKWIWDGILPDLVCIGCIAWRMRSNYISGWMGKTSDVDDVDIKGNTACICSFLCDYRRMHYQSDACEGR